MTNNQDFTITGVLLAGGQSRRMFAAPHNERDASGQKTDRARARDKCLEPLAGRPMLAHVIERFAPQVDALVLNANGDPARFSSFGLPIVADPIQGFAGPLAGVLAGLQWAREFTPEASHIATVSTDAPFLPQDLVARLRDTAQANRAGVIVIASCNGNRHPVIGLWPVQHIDDLYTQLKTGMRKVLHWSDRHGTILCDFEMTTIGDLTIDPFFNINHPQELEEARRLFDAATSG